MIKKVNELKSVVGEKGVKGKCKCGCPCPKGGDNKSYQHDNNSYAEEQYGS